ncbi:MAG: hypothetical protein Q7S58_05155 [Candidatus Binatus sp.]|uniref:hypothetical protein n=1 Tax=Candidatus Binatus sp. TaxID=2811406 RepID=UPI00271758E4|nr:hypothetical protein [Candidatus Binatus sp.]MDO8431781.1 hypothetical protein [Candidatus Binatus sp.]
MRTKLPPFADSEKSQRRLGAKRAILSAWDSFIEGAGKNLRKDLALVRFEDLCNTGKIDVAWALEELGRPANAITIKRWLKQRSDNGDLTPDAYGNRAGQGVINSNPKLRDAIIALHAEQPYLSPKGTMALLRERLRESAPARWPSQHQLRRFIAQIREKTGSNRAEPRPASIDETTSPSQDRFRQIAEEIVVWGNSTIAGRGERDMRSLIAQTLVRLPIEAYEDLVEQRNVMFVALGSGQLGEAFQWFTAATEEDKVQDVVLLSAEICKGSVARAMNVIAHECAHVFLNHAAAASTALLSGGDGEKEADELAVQWGFGPSYGPSALKR